VSAEREVEEVDKRVAEVIRKLAGPGTPEAVVEGILAHTLPSIRLVPRHPGEGRLGGTRLGDLPDLPDGVEWPRVRVKPSGELPLSFVMQVDLAEVAPLDLEGILPRAGLLSFFFHYDPHFEPREAGRVFFHEPGVELRRRKAPPDLPPGSLYRGFEVVPRLEWTAPAPDDTGLEEAWNLELWDTLEDDLAQVQGFDPYYEPRHRLLGHPQLLQADSLGGERLLLQVASDCPLEDKGYPATGMMWGDVGRVYYTMAEGDLRARRFDKAYAFMEDQ
jgi:uncharacterized protein YwqG